MFTSMCTQYVDIAFALNLAPYFHRNIGRGIESNMPTNANKLLPHPYPSAWYMLGANSGKQKAIRLLKNCDAAIALLVWSP